jgi:D-alanyl-lipoteichoic acid acyltransferase DltB (MBOAT superfamily)
MLFPTTDFAIFFLVAFTALWALNSRPVLWKLAALALSYFFYGWWDPRFVLLLVAETVIAHVAARALVRVDEPRQRRWVMIAGVGSLLGILAYFKYVGFFAVNVDNLARHLGMGNLVPLIQPTLPVAISFFTFMAISYVVDVYHRELEPARPLDLAVYLAFFPHLVAGPIVRGSELLPQIRRKRDADHLDYSRGFQLILRGMFKKVVISSYVASAVVDPVFISPKSHSALEVLFAIWGYAVQIYCDFSGYTDIAIGLALLLGIRFPVNFDAPYSAISLQDFWRRWHITLSRWLRDYLYIPLGGNRGSQAEVARNIMVTMILGGLWHGANWTFLIWGALHGGGQVVGHLRRQRREAAGLPEPSTRSSWRHWLSVVLTFQFVCLAWVFFRATSVSNALAMLARLVTGWSQSSPLVTLLLVATIAAVLLVQQLPPRLGDRLVVQLSHARLWVQVGLGAVVLLVITTLGPTGVAPFIYYRF